MIFRIANPVVFRFHVFCFPECIPQSQLFCGSSSTYAGDGPSKHCNRLLGVLSTASVQKLPCAFHRTNRNDKLPGNCKDNHSPPRARFNSMFEGCQCANQFLSLYNRRRPQSCGNSDRLCIFMLIMSALGSVSQKPVCGILWVLFLRRKQLFASTE